jgi:hypothetical protein
MNESDIRKAIASDAVRAGMIDDPDAMRLLDISAIKLDAAGVPILPHNFWRDAKLKKPHLFKKFNTGVDPAFNARTATEADYRVAERTLIGAAR